MNDDSIDAMLKRWGIWLYVQDDPGLYYDRVNMIHKLRQKPVRTTDWTDAEQVNAAVIDIMQAWPRIGIALKCWYEFQPALAVAKRKRDHVEIRRAFYMRRTASKITSRTFEDYVKQGRRLTQCHLAGQCA